MAGQVVHCQEHPAEVRECWLKSCLPSTSQATLPSTGLPQPDKALFSHSHKCNIEINSSPEEGKSYFSRLGLCIMGF